jgi:hypothetical protein
MKQVYWFTGTPRPSGKLEKYLHIVRAPDDPERSEREERKGQETNWRKAFAKGMVLHWELAILNHMADGKSRTFNRIMVEIADATADVAFDKGPDVALWNLVTAHQLEHTDEAPILFRRPPGYSEHYTGGKHTSLTACGRSTTLSNCGETIHKRWSEVTCLACIAAKDRITQQEQQTEEDEVSFKPRTTTKQNKKAAPKKEVIKDPVNPILAESARRMLANALVAARKLGEGIVQGHCRHCGESKGDKKTCCLLCAFSHYKDLAMDERDAAKMLMVPERWLFDVVSGFDRDGDEITYPSAKRLGAKLWRKYGAAKKARA